MIDTHAHVHTGAFDGDRAKVLTRAFASGLTALLEVSISPEPWPSVRRLAESDPRIFATVGIHPNDAGEGSLEELAALESALGHPRVRAVGETGLDYYRDHATPEDQQRLFRRHIALARDTGLPLVVHCRDAHDDVLRIVEDEGRSAVRGVMHCFSGDAGVARRSIDLGFVLGLGGSITYDEERWRPLAREIGLANIVLETDCPYMTPHPLRGRRNEPALVWHTAQALARYLDVSVDEVEEATDRNASSLFHLTAKPDRRANPRANPTAGRGDGS